MPEGHDSKGFIAQGSVIVVGLALLGLAVAWGSSLNQLGVHSTSITAQNVLIELVRKDATDTRVAIAEMGGNIKLLSDRLERHDDSSPKRAAGEVY